MSEKQRESFKQEVADGKWPNLALEDCTSGLLLEPFDDPANVAIIVTGSANGVTMVFKTNTGSTAKMGDNGPDFVPRPFMNRVIKGAAIPATGR